jgi:hypothetical protein
MALGAFEAFTVVLDDQRFLACRTNQDVEKVLRNHTRILRSQAPNHITHAHFDLRSGPFNFRHNSVLNSFDAVFVKMTPKRR